MERDAEARKLLRESGFEVEDFPDYLKADPTLLGYARRLPQELRAEYLRALLGFFRTYEQLDEPARAEMLECLPVSVTRGVRAQAVGPLTP